MRDPIPAHLNGYRIYKQYHLFEKYRYLVPSLSDVETDFTSPTGLYDKTPISKFNKNKALPKVEKQRHIPSGWNHQERKSFCAKENCSRF
jgi:hypothetical protein